MAGPGWTDSRDTSRWGRHIYSLDEIAGQRLLVVGHGALGDNVHLVRYVPQMQPLASGVTLAAYWSLIRLFQASGVAGNVIRHEDIGEWSGVWCWAPQLAPMLGQRLHNLTKFGRYLSIPAKVAEQQRLPASGKPRIGLAWKAGHPPEDKSIPWQEMRHILNCDAEFVSLQLPQDIVTEIACCPIGEASTFDFLDTAAIVDQLDLVIAVDTGTAHLAGSLGKPVWILLGRNHCPRWMHSGYDTSPWYPTAKLFWKQSDWAELIGRVKTALDNFLDQHV